jgi:hypothetical protein
MSTARPFTYRGQCHCGAIQVTLIASRPADELQVRACQCGFCTRQGAMTVSDPHGSAEIVIANGQLAPYQFETRTGTSLLCRTCGVYAGVIVEDEGRTWSALNVRGLALDGFAGRQPEPMVYDGETPQARIARRKQKWTPTVVRITPA